MTSAGTDEHPETAEIAAFAEGLLPAGTTAEIDGHLARCARCSAVRASLTELRDLLGDLPDPPPMPEAAVRRLDAALAAEALQRAAGVGPYAAPLAPGDGPGATGAPERPDDDAATHPVGGPQRVRVSRETSPPPGRPAGRSPGDAGPGRRPRGRRRWRALAAVAGAAVLGVGGVLAHAFTGGADAPPSATGQRGGTVERFSGTALPDKVHDLLAAATPKARPNITPGGENSPFSTRAPDVPGCVMKATPDPGALPLASSKGTYHGRIAYLVVLPDPAAPRDRVDAYVIDASCAVPGAPAGGDGQVLARETYSRR